MLDFCALHTHRSLAHGVTIPVLMTQGKHAPYFSLVGHQFKLTILGLPNPDYRVVVLWVAGKVVDGWVRVAESQFVSSEQSQQHVPEIAP